MKLLIAISFLSALLLPASSSACTCDGKQFSCNPDCVQICKPDGSTSEKCGKEAGALLLSIGKDTPSWKVIQSAARLFAQPEQTDVSLRDVPGGQSIRVPMEMIRPFAGISLNLNGVPTREALDLLAASARVKLEVAGRIPGTVRMNIRDTPLSDVMDDICEKTCAWSLQFSDGGWTLLVAGQG